MPSVFLHGLPDDAVSFTPTIATISLAALRHNVHQLTRQAGGPRLLAVVKADAYGHGAVTVSRVLREEGVEDLAVATVPEAIRLREAGLDGRILIFAAPLPEYLPAYQRYGLDLTVPSVAAAEAAAALASPTAPLRVHVKVDTGMGRIGVPPAEAPALIEQLRQAPGITLAGVWTHFASTRDAAFTQTQVGRFASVLQAIDVTGLDVHLSNSGALYRTVFPDEVPQTMVRTGIGLYGAVSPALQDQLKPVMRLTSRITQVKTVPEGTPISYGSTWHAPRSTRIATVSAGYADGYRRGLTNTAQVGIGGQKYPAVGTVCMDMFMVDLGPEGTGPAIHEGDEVVLFGPGGPSAYDVAQWLDTIPYEICCGVGTRVPRRYVEPVHEGDG